MITSKPLSRDLVWCCSASTQPRHNIPFKKHKALLPTICSFSSTFLSNMSIPASESAAMEKLHQFICQQAFDRAHKPSLPAGFIGPISPPPSSTFIGQRWLKEGPPNEPTIRVMFRCQSSPNGGSRHVLLHLKPSVTEESLATKLCQIFEVPANGGVITKTMPRFMPGLCPLRDPNRGTTLSSSPLALGSSH